MAGQEQHRHGHRRRVVLFPLPFQGHLIPMLQLAALLRARGLEVTVLHANLNFPDPARHPDLAFVPIHETLPDEVTSPGNDIVRQLLALNAACEAPFREGLASLLRGQDVACAVVDGQCYAALVAASQLGVPALALRTDSAATFRSMLAYPRLRDAGFVPIKEERLDELVPKLEPLRVRDLIRVDGSDTDALCSFITTVADAIRASASGVVINTFEAIEAAELAKIQHELSRPAFAVGPLHLLAQAPVEQSLYVLDRGCLDWLDAHPPRSVLYVSLGSVACVDRNVFEEMACGLASSGVPFLWVVRPGSVRGVGEEVPLPPLPDGVNEEVRNRGKIVKWAPQREVLAHNAIGAFWTHCGWNSTLESVCEGVPMLAQPCFADQMVNARYVTHEWGVGLEVGEVIERERVAKAVTKLMVGEDGAQMRERAQHLQMQASAATSLSMDSLVQYISSL
ncbi:DIMBOA UDP-glucosyltransferase BX8-like [Phragmites australis]|uniref:DIMBOA UDP-glucosyltransferase BX8-like n=1 Tax=Phragmites australis TaxID=29695 RepID=UPI002D790111|nr:DIMBOA UDP-glucosyltransferase BX8-like [Phragmites australis]